MYENENTTQTPPEYVMRFDLANDPFSPDFSNDYVFYDAGRREVFDQLVHLGRFSDRPVLLTGKAGSGKSTLVEALVNQLHTVMDCCRVMGDEFTSSDDIITGLSESLHLPIGAGASLVEFIAALRSTGIVDDEPEPVLVIVERADALNESCMDSLLSLGHQSNGVVHLLLVGEESLVDRVASIDENFKQFALDPLNATEVASFVLGLLQSVGFADEEALTLQQAEELCAESQGNIAEIKQLAPAYLLMDANVIVEGRAFSLPSTHIVVVIFLLAALVLGYILLAEEDEYKTLEQSVPALVERQVIREKKPLELKKTESVTEVSSEEISSGMPFTGESPTETNSQEVVAKEEEKPVAPAPSEELPKPEVIEENTAIADVQKPAELAPKEAVKDIKQPESKLSERERRLLSVPESAYMLQLLGARNEANAQGLVKRYSGRLPISYFETRLKDKPWFVVVAGPYNTKDAARAGIKHLPPELKGLKPWLRRVGDIKDDIRKVNRS